MKSPSRHRRLGFFVHPDDQALTFKRTSMFPRVALE